MAERKKRIQIDIRKAVLALTLFAASLFLWPSCDVFAVPAAPGSYGDSGEQTCFSVTAEEMVTLEVLEQKKKEKQKEKGTLTAAAVKGSTDYTIPLLMIVVGFRGTTQDAPQGLPYSNDYDWGKYVFEGDNSVTKYYKDMSLGKFTFVPVEETSAYGKGGNSNLYDRENDGVVHVMIDAPHGVWDDLENLDEESFYKATAEAIRSTAPYVDFSSFDTDKDRLIVNSELAICFVMAGYDASVAEKKYQRSNFLWPFAYSFEDMERGYPVVDGVSPNRFVSMSEQKLPEKKEISYLLVLFHELGHYLGLPDLYNTESIAKTEWSDYKVGKMSLMATGCWGVTRNGDYSCYSMDVWSRYKLGWLTAKEITGDSSVTVTGEDLYYIPAAGASEYYLVENHRFTGWDRDMAYGILIDAKDYMSAVREGLVIWHIDEDAYRKYEPLNRVNSWSHRPSVMPLFPEYRSDGTPGVITDSKRGAIVINPFRTFRELNGTVDLPCYGKAEEKDNRMARYLSGIRLKTDNNGDEKITLQVSFDASRGELPRGWVKVNGSRSFYDKSGNIVKNTWKQATFRAGQTHWYYLDEQGKLSTGWKKIRGSWYFFDKDGAMQTGWIKESGKWYLLGTDGAMKTGWQKERDTWYYLSSDGVMSTGWKEIGITWYFFDGSGAMVTGEKTIRGTVYRFSSTGAWIA